ncbi:MAG TPA: GTPase HflX, partial [Natronosporangium sp.]|nr:GTPase HflX [Natronosporangium sp.]
EETLLRLKRQWPDAVFVSARTGAGLEDLTAAIEARLPHPSVQVTATVPYDRGDLVARLHQRGEVIAIGHEPTGTRVTARVDPELAAALAPYRDEDGVA